MAFNTLDTTNANSSLGTGFSLPTGNSSQPLNLGATKAPIQVNSVNNSSLPVLSFGSNNNSLIPQNTSALTVGPLKSQSVDPTTGATSSEYHLPTDNTPTVAQGTYGTIQNFPGGGAVYSDPRDNPNYTGGLNVGTQGINFNPVNFQTNTGNSNTINSTALSGGMTLSDLLNKQQSSLSGLLNGTGTGTPTSSLQAEVAGQLYKSTLYSPDQLQAIQRMRDAQTAVNNRTIQETADIKNLMDGGTFTKDQAQGAIQEIQRRANEDLAFLSGTQANYANTVAVNELQRQNQIAALTGLQSGIAPQQVAPGSSLYSPVTGSMYQGMGAAPAQIASYAQQLKQNDQITGQVHINPQTGVVDDNYYYQQAQQQLSGMGSSSGGSVNGGSSVGGGNSGGVYGQGGYGNVSALPQAFQQYAISPQVTTPSGTQSLSFIQAERVPTGLQDTVKQAAQAAGIPYLDQAGANAAYAAQQILQISEAAKALSIRNLGKGVTGRVGNTLTNWANNFLQFNPDLSNFGQLRDAASKATTALAGGVGSGFRMNMGIIDAAVQNLPTASDNLETALAKADALSTQIVNGLQPLFPGLKNQGLLDASGGSSQTQGSQFTGNAWK